MNDTTLKNEQLSVSSSSRRKAMRIMSAALGAPILLAGMGRAMAQTSKLLRIIVPYAPGGGTDILARQLAEAMTGVLGYPVIIENKPGAGTNIGAAYVVRSAPDGSTLLMGDLALAVNPSLFKTMQFSPVKDLRPIAPVGNAPLVLVVNPDLKVRSVKDLVALAKSQPGKLSFATAGYGNPPHIAGELFRTTADINIIQVPYKGVGPALVDLIGGQVSMLFTGLSSARPQIDAGTVIPLAVTGDARAQELPNVPTMAEAGFPQVDATSWWGLFGPAGVPNDVADAITAATQTALSSPQLKDRLATQSISVWSGAASVLGQRLATETKRWHQVMQAANITPQ